MNRLHWVTLGLWVLGVLASPSPVDAQSGEGRPALRTAGTVTNLFGTVDPSSSVDGIRLQLPTGWQVQDIHLLRYGTEPIAVRSQVNAHGNVLLLPEHSLRRPHELVLRVRIGEDPGLYRWHLTPFSVTENPASDSLEEASARPEAQKRRRFHSAKRQTRRVNVESPSSPDGENRALDLGQAAQPLSLDLPASLSLGRDASFTVEFWMRTSGLNQVLLSTWSGEKQSSYSAEFVVDQSGRLRFYCGRSGRHQALRTKRPVANHQWHHAAVVYDQAETRLHLVLDGRAVDSMQARALPSPTGPSTVALGGRQSHETGDPSETQRYTGRLDEVLIWAEARSLATLRRRKEQGTARVSSNEGDGPLRLDFNQGAPAKRLDWAEGALRVPTSLSFRAPLRNLRAHTEGRTVTLRWQTDTVGEGPFIVERSDDGTTFSSVARVRPSGVASPSVESREVTYTDENVPGQIVYYRIRQKGPDGTLERTTGTIKIGLGAESADQKTVTLVGNFPNPFETSTTIAYRVEEPQSLTLTVWDLSGKLVATLSSGKHDPGYYEKTFDATDLPSGHYFARLETPQGEQSLRMVLLK